MSIEVTLVILSFLSFTPISSNVHTTAVKMVKKLRWLRQLCQLDYIDIICDKSNNMDACNKIKSLIYNAALTITGAIGGSSKLDLYQELGFEYLSSKRWLRKLCLFHNIVVNTSPNYLYNCFNG